VRSAAITAPPRVGTAIVRSGAISSEHGSSEFNGSSEFSGGEFDGSDAEAPSAAPPATNGTLAQLPHNSGHSRLLFDCLGLATIATLLALAALRRINRFEREGFVNSFVLMHKVSDQRELLSGERVELLAIFSNPAMHPELKLQPLKLGRELKSLLNSVPSCYMTIQPAAALRDARAALHEHNPQVALFSGHCFMGRLVFELPSGEVELPSSAELVAMLAPPPAAVTKHPLGSRLRCVVLNSCDTFSLGVEIVKRMPHLAVVCWWSLAEDNAARAFALGFYGHMGDTLIAGEEELSLESAYAAGFESFRESGYVYGDPAPYLHPPGHPHLRSPCFSACAGCCPPVHGRPVLLRSVNGELRMREGGAEGVLVGEGGSVREGEHP